jgi:hypothetical protein
MDLHHVSAAGDVSTDAALGFNLDPCTCGTRGCSGGHHEKASQKKTYPLSDSHAAEQAILQFIPAPPLRGAAPPAVALASHSAASGSASARGLDEAPLPPSVPQIPLFEDHSDPADWALPSGNAAPMTPRVEDVTSPLRLRGGGGAVSPAVSEEWGGGDAASSPIEAPSPEQALAPNGNPDADRTPEWLQTAGEIDAEILEARQEADFLLECLKLAKQKGVKRHQQRLQADLDNLAKRRRTLTKHTQCQMIYAREQMALRDREESVRYQKCLDDQREKDTLLADSKAKASNAKIAEIAAKAAQMETQRLERERLREHQERQKHTRDHAHRLQSRGAFGVAKVLLRATSHLQIG